MKKIILIFVVVTIAYFSLRPYSYLIDSVKVDTGIAEINVPDGFVTTFYAQNVEGARSLAVSDSGIVYVGTRKQGKVYALEDVDDDFKIDNVYEVATGLNSPNGVVWHDGTLYVAEISRIIKFENIDKNYKSSPDYSVVYSDLPDDTHHGWKYIDIGPDNKLYVPIGAPCNICQTDGTPHASINRLNLDGSGFELVAKGIRNTVGFDWHPLTNVLYFTDNGRDWLGDDVPPDEFNIVSKTGEYFGFPYCHGTDIKDPEFGANVNCSEYTPSLVELGPHVAALGVKFYTGNMFPSNYKNLAFIAEHGSWNRTEPIGYRITLVNTNTNSYEVFADGWLDKNGEAWGRPVDVEILHDGSLIVSDDLSGSIYRISYTK